MLLVVVLVVAAVGAGVAYLARDPGPDRPPAGEPGSTDFFAGFATTSFRIVPDGTPPGETGATARRCALLAETAEQRERGLMGARSLEGHDGMIFRFETDTSGGFWMKDTPMPLSIAWFTATGELVGRADMDPCLGRPSCPTYAPPTSYRFALEVPQGRLAALGVEPGARLVVGGPC